jgi:hypothetical protein
MSAAIKIPAKSRISNVAMKMRELDQSAAENLVLARGCSAPPKNKEELPRGL